MLHCRRHASLPALIAAFAVGAMLCAVPGRAVADTSAWSTGTDASVRLLAAGREAGHLLAGVEVQLSPGWKTYWRYPGDAGVPPRFDWAGSENVADVEVLWPAPMRFDDGTGVVSIGYKRDVVFPVRVRPVDPAKPVMLHLALDFAVCEKLCVPANGAANLTLAADGGDESLPELIAAFARVPQKAGVAADGVVSLTVDKSATPPVLRIETAARDPKADLFVEGPSDEWALPLPVRTALPNGRVLFTLPMDGMPKDADPATTALRITFIDGARALDVTSPPQTR